jgi:SpoVK/Ycf46/Vps4 family AAA+-type ATPase
MEQINKFMLLESIGQVYKKSRNCELDDAFYSDVEKELKLLSEYFNLSRNQSLLFAVVFTKNLRVESVSSEELFDYFDCIPTKILQLHEDIEFLCSSSYLIECKKSRKMGLIKKNEFIVNRVILDAIQNNQKFPSNLTVKREKNVDVLNVLEELCELSVSRDNDEISTKDLFTQATQIIMENLHFPLIKMVDTFELNTEEKYFYLYLIWKTLLGDESVRLSSTFDDIYDSDITKIDRIQNIRNGTSPLIRKNLIELEESYFYNNPDIKLSDKSVEILKENGINLSFNKKKQDNIILHENIVQKDLIFSHTEMEQLHILKELLYDDKLKSTQQRLVDKKMPKGLTVLLHGAPGTGKTEIVKQIARETGRELMKVEISQVKSKWFGDSEKLVKRVFTDYNSYVQNSEKLPILFFNEADAIISKRKDIGSSNVVQTENTIQNILLEEMENFEGILVATTNLTNNIDAAFERRFLFKIQFNKPDLTIREKIWKAKLPFLDNEECKTLASKFEFSGGQIDNICRKNEINEVLCGEKLTVSQIIRACKDETMMPTIQKLGFK